MDHFGLTCNDLLSFTNIESVIKDVNLQEEVASYFPHTPQIFWLKTCKDHNGFFGCHESSATSFDPLSDSRESFHSTYFRLIVKLLTNHEYQGRVSPNGVIPYQWHEMAFLSSSSSSSNIMLCFDVPDSLIMDLESCLSVSPGEITGAYALHIPLLEQLIRLYDRSIWGMARTVRKIEKVLHRSMSLEND